MPKRADVVVVGGGIVGLAAAREVTIRRPDMSVVVLEAERDLAQHQTLHNSGVIHSGVYYRPGSLKARCCVGGSRALYAYCGAAGIPTRRIGKVIVAATRQEIAALDELQRRGEANGVVLDRLRGAHEIAAVEPNAVGVEALHIRDAGVVDYPQVAAAFAHDVRRAGGTIVTNCAVSHVSDHGHTAVVDHADGRTEASAVIACAGAWSDRLARRSGLGADPRIVPFRGAYLRLRPHATPLVRGMIYPVPDPELPFLGVHFTPTVRGDVLIGPTALLVAARDGYRLRTFRVRDFVETVTWPGTYRMARRWWRNGATEILHAIRSRSLISAARRYVPELDVRDVEPGPAGVRAQAVARDGGLVDDFVLEWSGNTLFVRNAPSPAATSSLAIAEILGEELEVRLRSAYGRRNAGAAVT